MYKGIGAVVMGIVPKMAIRFSSFEMFKESLANKETGKNSSSSIFLAGLGAGLTEAVLVVTPMDVLKISTFCSNYTLINDQDYKLKDIR